MRIIAALVLVFCLSLPGLAVQAKKHSSSKSVPSKAAASKKTAGKKGTRSAASRKRAQRKPAGQTAPTPERYKQIQQALIDKGYGPHAADGVWDSEWSGALKRFQQDQKLEPTGKVNSLSLITLGLGPKREAPAGATPPPVVPANQQTSSSSTVREPK